MKKEVKHLYNKALDSLILSIELFNRPNDACRIHGVLIFMDHSFEMLLKSCIVHKGGQIIEKGAKQTIGFSSCVRKAFSDGQLKFLSEEQVLILQTLNGLRDAAQHYTLEMSEQHLYFQAQAGLTLFRDVVLAVYKIDLKTKLPVRVLPLSTTPPVDIQAFFSNEAEEVKKLLRPNSRKNIEATERLRALTIVENSIQGIETQPTTDELSTIKTKIKSGQKWSEIFPGVSTLTFTHNGYGPSLDLRIIKKEGVPITIVPDGTPGAAVVAIKRVNELEFYNIGRDELAKKVNLTGPKTSAAIAVFKIKDDVECFKQIKISKSFFDRYSQKAVASILNGMKGKSESEIWAEYRALKQ